MDFIHCLTVMWKSEVFYHLLRQWNACSISIVPHKLDFTLLLIGFYEMRNCDLVVCWLDWVSWFHQPLAPSASCSFYSSAIHLHLPLHPGIVSKSHIGALSVLKMGRQCGIPSWVQYGMGRNGYPIVALADLSLVIEQILGTWMDWAW